MVFSISINVDFIFPVPQSKNLEVIFSSLFCLTSSIVKKSGPLYLQNISRIFLFLTIPITLAKTTVLQENDCSSLQTGFPTSNVACLHSVPNTVARVVILKYESSLVTPAHNHPVASYFTESKRQVFTLTHT